MMALKETERPLALPEPPKFQKGRISMMKHLNLRLAVLLVIGTVCCMIGFTTDRLLFCVSSMAVSALLCWWSFSSFRNAGDQEDAANAEGADEMALPAKA